MLRLIGIIIFLGCSFMTFAQTKKTKPLCQINEPPQLRGFFLGETVEEISEVIPNFKEAFLEKAILARKNNNSVVIMSSVQFFYEDGNRKNFNKDFEDVDFFWHFFENKLYFIGVNYTVFRPQNLQDFIKQLSEKTKLPLKGWFFEDKYHATLKCNGFTIEVFTGGVEGSHYEGYPSIILIDTNAQAEIKRREAIIELQKKKEEKERIRRERERRNIFKP